MEKTLYTQISSIALFAKNYYLKYNKCLDFTYIILKLHEKNLLDTSAIRFRRAKSFLSPTDFRTHVYSQIVYVNPIFLNFSESVILETNTIPPRKDIFTAVHLPYILHQMHTHDFFELTYVYQGSCTLFFESESRVYEQGAFCIISPNFPHYFQTSNDGLALCINIRQSTFDNTFHRLLCNDDLLASFFKHSLYTNHSGNYLSLQIGNTTAYNPLIQQVFDESNLDDSYSNDIAISLVNVFFGKLLRDFGSTITLYKDVSTSSFTDDFPLLLKYVQANYSTINLSSLSEMFHYSTVHISRMFKKNLNQNFSNVLQDLKTHHAKLYLENTDYTIAEIAELVGYESPDYLTRVFKNKYSVTPSTYRNHL